MEKPKSAKSRVGLGELLGMICIAGIYILGRRFWDPAKAGVTMVLATATIATILTKPNLRKFAWFWTTLLIFALAHIPLIAFVTWAPAEHTSMLIYMPFCLLDFHIAAGIIGAREKRMAKRTQSS